MAPTNPAPEAYAVLGNSRLSRKDMPYSVQNQGLGIILNHRSSYENVLTNRDGDCVRCSAAHGGYASMILSLIIDHMKGRKMGTPVRTIAGPSPAPQTPEKKCNRVGERESFDAVMKNEIFALATKADYEPEEATTRRLNSMWKIMSGFNTEGNFNEQLDKILLEYSKIRVGTVPKMADELEAAISAAQAYYLTSVKDNKTTGKGIWTLPIVHLLNEHMIKRGMTPISFSDVGTTDDAVQKDEREIQSKVIWIDGNCFKAEARTDVADELVKFAFDIFGETIGPIPECQGEPEADPNEQRPSKRARRELRRF